MFSFGVIGVGTFGTFLIESIGRLPNARVGAVAARREERANNIAEQFRIPRAYTNYRELLQDSEIDGVVIATPPHSHFAVARDSLLAGKHLLVEKPPCLRIEELHELINLAAEKHLKAAVDYEMRFHPLYTRLNSIVSSNILGKLLRIDFNNLATDEHLPSDHWFWDKKQSGGIFVEHGVHFFDIYEQMLGHPTILFSQTYSRSGGIEDRVNCVLQYQDGIYATFSHSFDRPYVIERTYADLIFEMGVVRIEGWIPLRLSGFSLIEKDMINRLSSVVGKSAVIKVESFPRNTTGRGRVLKQPQLVSFEEKLGSNPYDVGQDKDRVFRQIVQALITNFLEAVENDVQPLTSLQTAVGSLSTALESAGRAR